MRRMVWWGAVMAVAACAGKPSPVPVVGPTQSVAALAGDWSGEYRSVETGRSGNITFRLEAGKDTAVGDVLMVPREVSTGMPQQAQLPDAHRALPEVLTIRFVRVSGSTVSGTINPYKSPDCSCLLSTIFRGEILGDRIEGDFLIRHSEHDSGAQRGTWWVKRIPKRAAP